MSNVTITTATNYEAVYTRPRGRVSHVMYEDVQSGYYLAFCKEVAAVTKDEVVESMERGIAPKTCVTCLEYLGPYNRRVAKGNQKASDAGIKVKPIQDVADPENTLEDYTGQVETITQNPKGYVAAPKSRKKIAHIVDIPTSGHAEETACGKDTDDFGLVTTIEVETGEYSVCKNCIKSEAKKA